MCLRHTSGFVHGQAARSRGLPGVLRLHVREKHPQRFPYCGSGLHEQTAACGQTQPCAPPLQETPTPSQQDRAALLHIQQGQVQELFHYVNTAEMQKKKQGHGKNCSRFSGVFSLQHPSKHSLTLWDWTQVESPTLREWKTAWCWYLMIPVPKNRHFKV